MSINIKNLSLYYPLYDVDSKSFKKSVFDFTKNVGGRLNSNNLNTSSTLCAINNICLHIKEGDRVGLVGGNGSGKTTLLRLISGIYKPTFGTIEVEGSVTTLLDMASGMIMDATGYENIYLRSYVLGKSTAEIDEKINEIIEFSELGNFIYLPLKRYSAGMHTRLAFAISTAYKPDILIIDEGIGAGDESFHKRAHERFKNFNNSTKILLFASHSEKLLKDNCNKILTLKEGKIESYI